MQVIITDARFARSRTIYLAGPRLLQMMLAMSLCMMLVAVGLYHWVFLQGARQWWPVVGDVVRMVARDEFTERDRFMRANLGAMARRVGDMQARMVQLDSLGERVLGLADLAPDDMHRADGRGGRVGGRAAADHGRIASHAR